MDEVNVKTFGAKGDGVTDDTRAIKRAIQAACPSTSWKANKGLYFPPGTYLISDNLEVGNPAWRYFGINIIGIRGLSFIKRKQPTTPSADGMTDGIFVLHNPYQAVVKDIQLGYDGAYVDFGVWFKAHDGQSALEIRTDNLTTWNTRYGMIIGGGKLMSSGQCNAGYHTGYAYVGRGNAVLMTGANVECQTFHGIDFGVLALDPNDRCQPAIAFKCLNGRGVYINGGEIDFIDTGYGVVLDGEGGMLHGAGYSIENLRLEDAWSIIRLGTENTDDWCQKVGAVVSIRNIDNESDFNQTTNPFPTIPCPMVYMHHAGTVYMENVKWNRDNSHIEFYGLTDTWGKANLVNCHINNENAVATPGSLLKVTPSNPNYDHCGAILKTDNCFMIDRDEYIVPNSSIPDMTVHKTKASP